MADVAAHVGVSHQTVSRVLNGSPLVRDDTRGRVLAAIEELGYRRNSAARMLATNRSGRIGMISAHLALHGPSMHRGGGPGSRPRGRLRRVARRPARLSPQSLREAVDRLLDQAVEALVVAVAHRDALDLARSLEVPIPVVVVQA